ncbi:unnamed protein product [Nippostrongylus brasiliensis]|uniref:Methyltransf_25 domain-containing protein n=1 Tax=Nippostrongylus brasiliensis TaxID=27835 RepID=A0A0N4YVX7_NIPBR|nr:unnamed protein product [Nippostrongylus brasiliensis]
MLFFRHTRKLTEHVDVLIPIINVLKCTEEMDRKGPYRLSNRCISKKLIDGGAAEVLGVDSSEEMVATAMKNFGDVKGLQFKHQSISAAHYNGAGVFDVAVAFLVLQFMKDEQELRSAIQNISNSLKADGSLVAIVPNGVRDYNPTRTDGRKFGAAVNLKDDPKLHDGRRLDVEFVHPVISVEGLKLYGDEFFASYLSPPKDIVIRAYKSRNL